MFRFFVHQKENNYFLLNDEAIKHIKVARITNQNIICVYEHKFYVCTIEGKKAKIIKKLNDNHEFNGNLVLAASVPVKKKFEWLIQKATELGVKTIIPVLSKNTSFKITNLKKNIKRWQKIAQSAAQQSFRNIIPQISDPLKFEEVINYNLKNKFISYERADCQQVLISLPTDAIFLVGPEGGFTDQEIKMATDKGFKVISLGKRILRSETAAIFILSRINDSHITK